MVVFIMVSVFWAFAPEGSLWLDPSETPPQTAGSVHPLQTSFSFQGHHSCSCLHKNPMMIFCPSPPRLGWDDLEVPPAELSPVVPPCYTTDTKVSCKARQHLSLPSHLPTSTSTQCGHDPIFQGCVRLPGGLGWWNCTSPCAGALIALGSIANKHCLNPQA